VSTCRKPQISVDLTTFCIGKQKTDSTVGHSEGPPYRWALVRCTTCTTHCYATETARTWVFADGRFLAIGCQDSNVYVYEALDDCHVFRRYKNGVLKVCTRLLIGLQYVGFVHYKTQNISINQFIRQQRAKGHLQVAIYNTQ